MADVDNQRRECHVGGEQPASARLWRVLAEVLMTLAVERFAKYRQVMGVDECWPWVGTKTKHGYGIFFSGKCVTAHRFAYEMAFGPIPRGLVVDHRCERRDCVNPNHLEVVTQAENLLRCKTGLVYLGLQKTSCVNGHSFTEGNNYRDPRHGHRQCRICRRAAGARRAERPGRAT